MKKYIVTHPWQIIEEKFVPQNVRGSESIFSIGNGRMGQRANFEEKYSGDTLQGNYYAGIYYPDKTKVGWWKNGYPEYFAKVLNGTNWIGINICVVGEELDLAVWEINSFKRILDMKTGVLLREFTATSPKGRTIEVKVSRFLSIVDQNIGAISYEVTPMNFSGEICFSPYLDGDVANEDSNYEEKFWDEVEKIHHGEYAFLQIKTKKLDFHLCSAMTCSLVLNNSEQNITNEHFTQDKYIGWKNSVEAIKNDTIYFYKYVATVSNFYHPVNELIKEAGAGLSKASQKGFDVLFEEHSRIWDQKWQKSDIIIEGDTRAQQAIRFNIFQLNQTYTGDDERLNIGPKGFTGEKYGGSTYWDTEAYALPFYLCTADQQVAKNLLLYRYKHLGKAIENAEKLGFTNGAALYPMVTMNGEECHNEWEITFEEIHRNGAMSYAIFNYIKHTADKTYLIDYGLEVLIALSRFWAQRVNFSKQKNKYVILGVTGPNEYENNINNNWYTNKLAHWTLKYTLETIQFVKKENEQKYNNLKNKIHFQEHPETAKWKDIIDNLHFPHIEGTRIFLQQDNYLDKEDLTVNDLDENERPLNQFWSWDRILRSPFIKQADTLQGIYWFEEEFELQTIKDNFNYYEARTVHESSLSPCVHACLACKTGEVEKAYELYLRTSRLDLDDYNNEVHEGLHITSMAGTWMSIVEGFGGKRIINGTIAFNPVIPNAWKSYSFTISFRSHTIKLHVTHDIVSISNLSSTKIYVYIYGEICDVKSNATINLNYEKQA